MKTAGQVPTDSQPAFSGGQLARTEALLVDPAIYDEFGDVIDPNVPYYFCFVFGCSCGIDTNVFIPIGSNGMPPEEIIMDTAQYLTDPAEPASVKMQLDPKEPKHILFWPSCSNEDCDHEFSVVIPLALIQRQVLADCPVTTRLN